MDKIRVLVADDHAILRAGLKTLLNAQPDIEVVAEASDGEETVRRVTETSPDIVLMDVTMPGLSGVDATQRIQRDSPASRILALSMHEDQRYLYEMLRAGASGYVPKKAADTELLDAIRATYRGENFIHSSMTAGLVSEIRDRTHSVPPPKTTNVSLTELSQREREVLRLVALGHTSKQIADQLFLSTKTVDTYKARLKEKLGIQRLAELVRYAIESGLMDTGA